MAPKLTPEQEVALRRAIVFKPCKTKQHLQDWLREFLDVDLPDTVVDPTSNSCPMDLIWEIYEKAIDGHDENFQRILAFAARDSYKSFAAAVLEVLMVVHLDRDVAHMAAQKPQAIRVQRYVKKFLSSPFLKPYVVAKNDSNVSLVRFMDANDMAITEKEWSKLSSSEQVKYRFKSYTIEIVVATVAGANSAHVSFMCIDELDVMPNKVAYEEAKAIPAPRDGKLPITFLTSSRKFSFGLVQTEIDEAKKTGTHIRNWNILDVTARCPEKRHLPLLPKIPIWVDEEELSAISDEEYKSRAPAVQARYVEKTGFQGCLSNCKAFSYCQGRLAEANRAEEGDFLKPIASVQQSIRQASLNMANAQYLCKKPSSEGLVYTHFDRAKHCKYPWQIKEMISDEPADKRMTKEDLLKWLKTVEGGRWYAGYDWGFTHNFVAVLGFKYGYNLYVVDAVVEAGLDAVEKVEACDKKGWKSLEPVGFPDPESPSEIKTFKKAGYNMKPWDKGAGSVLAGIEVVRTKLRPGHGREPQVYFLTVDPNNGNWDQSGQDPDSEGTIWSHQHYVEDAEKEDLEIVIRSHQLYHWKQDKAQRSTKEPDEEGADECDAVRYMTMNVFPIKKDTQPHAPTPEETAPPAPRAPSFWEQISAEVGVELGKTERESAPTKRKGKWFISE